jgi:predicted dehydrogenase
MRVVVAGLGIQGRKRRAIAGEEVVATVDPVVSGVDYRAIEQVPLDSYDAVLACIPDDAKLRVVGYALSHGKHVLVEKPLFAPGDELKALAALARSSGAACYTAYNHRFEPHIARMRDVLASGAIGRPYLARMFYGNGTAQDVKASPWRDKGMGVVPDLCSHLLDTANFLFDSHDFSVDTHVLHAIETRAPDYALFAFHGEPPLILEMMLLSWRNTFHLDVIGEQGSAHIYCLCKWGPSTFTLRRRVFPSGRPTEEAETLTCPDPTWKLEYEHFKTLCRTGGTNIETDIWIQSVLEQLARIIEAPE